MDLVWGISLEESLGIVGLALGVRAELRARFERRHGEATRKAVASAELTSLLNVASGLTVTSPDLINRIAADRDVLEQLSKRASSAIPVVAEAFPTAATALDNLRQQTIEIRAVLAGAKATRPIDRNYRLLYALLVALSYYALVRHGVSGRKVDRLLVERDEFVTRFRGYHEKFQLAELARLGVEV